jgi:hypothetical protein
VLKKKAINLIYETAKKDAVARPQPTKKEQSNYYFTIFN